MHSPGAVDNCIFDIWRALPRPANVVYLDVDIELAWQRAGAGRRVNRMEHYGREPTRDGFVRFQSDLRDLMLKETAAVETTVLQRFSDENPPVADTERILLSTWRMRSNDHRTGRIRRLRQAATPGVG